MAVRKVAITLPEELYELVERARAVEHRSRSEIIQEALRTHFANRLIGRARRNVANSSLPLMRSKQTRSQRGSGPRFATTCVSTGEGSHYPGR